VQIGRYRLIARLGSGGMGVVYLGGDPGSGDGGPVAVKVLRPELADDSDFRRRFRHEVSALMRVKGVCTVRVIEADTEAERPFMVTEYADGPSLSEHIATYGPLDPGMLSGLAAGLAEALTVIHAAGLVHRDLKPSNVILTDAGPKVIDFGIARALDAMSVTRTGTMVGSAGFMAPEQISGHPGPAADVFVWGVTVAYAASGKPPFGAGATDAVLYRVMYADPDITGTPGPLRPLVEAALAKDPQDRPTARELLSRLASASLRSHDIADAPTQIILARTWPHTGPDSGRRGLVREDGKNGSVLLSPVPPGADAPRHLAPRARRGQLSRRARGIGVSALAITVAVTAVIVAMLAGHTPKIGAPTASEASPGAADHLVAGTLPMYPGQRQRGVFQVISRIVAVGNTMVTTGWQTADGVVRQQFFASSDAGHHWRLAGVRMPGGGQPPLGHAAALIAGSPRGWMAEGPDSVWTSPDGLSWTLAATHGISPQQPGDSIDVVTSTPNGFLAGGSHKTSSGSQAVLWISKDGVRWQRLTAGQLGLTEAGATAANIDFATSRGSATVIADRGSGVWLSTDSGSTWSAVQIPVDHGARNAISGVSFDRSGLVMVRPGATARGASDGVAYFSPDGQAWRYAGTIDAAGGWIPAVVKGSDYGFVVTGTTSTNQYMAYVSTDAGATWQPTGPVGDSSTGPPPTATLGPDGAVVAVGSQNRTATGQQAVFVTTDRAGHVRRVSLSAVPGGLIPEEAVHGTAITGGQQIAVGAADGFPAVWHRTADGSWSLVSLLARVSGDAGLAGLSAVTHGPAGWLAVGPGPVVLTSADGTTWRPATAITRDLAGVAAVAAASGPAGYVIAGKLVEPDGTCLPDVWWSSDLTGWTKAHDVNQADGSSQVLAVAAGPSGFVSAGSHDGKPAVWTTNDGRAWTTVAIPLAAGATAGWIQQVAISGTRMTALGQQTTANGLRPLAEVSADGGLTWQPVPFGSPGPGISITALAGGPGGFTAAAQFSAAGGALDAAVWTSADGSTWTRSEVSGLTGGGIRAITALARSGSAVTGINSVQTQAAQQFTTLTLAHE
jgi:Protein kinase domain